MTGHPRPELVADVWIALLVACCMAIYYWQYVLPALALYVAYRLITRWWDNRVERSVNMRLAEMRRVARLRRNAKREHRLVQEGKVNGIYGDFPVPEECERLGIWLCD